MSFLQQKRTVPRATLAAARQVAVQDPHALLGAHPVARRGVTLGATAATPRHVAIIMDGNGRWATARGQPRALGHRAGARAVRRAVEAAIEGGIPWLTLYAFSRENWRRPADEIRDLTGLLRHYLRHEIEELHGNGVRLRVIGERRRFGDEIGVEIAAAEARTLGNLRLQLTVALSYGAREEIVEAMRRVAELARAGVLDPALIDEAMVGGLLYTAGAPDPDLIIRTSGEQRLSNFLLWQAAYAEFVFLDVLWPDFERQHFQSALATFANRDRRFGARPG